MDKYNASYLNICCFAGAYTFIRRVLGASALCILCEEDEDEIVVSELYLLCETCKCGCFRYIWGRADRAHSAHLTRTRAHIHDVWWQRRQRYAHMRALWIACSEGCFIYVRNTYIYFVYIKCNKTLSPFLSISVTKRTRAPAVFPACAR